MEGRAQKEIDVGPGLLEPNSQRRQWDVPGLLDINRTGKHVMCCFKSQPLIFVANTKSTDINRRRMENYKRLLPLILGKDLYHVFIIFVFLVAGKFGSASRWAHQPTHIKKRTRPSV